MEIDDGREGDTEVTLSSQNISTRMLTSGCVQSQRSIQSDISWIAFIGFAMTPD